MIGAFMNLKKNKKNCGTRDPQFYTVEGGVLLRAAFLLSIIFFCIL